MVEAYCLRKLPNHDFGKLMDAHHSRLGVILRQMYNALQPEAVRPPAIAPPRLAPSPNGQQSEK